MRRTVLKSVAVAGVLAMGIAACSSKSNSSGGSSPAASTGKTLVVESTSLSPMTDTFSPYSATSTGYVTHAVGLYNEPLFIFNTLNSTEAPVPMLATGYTWSNGGKTLGMTIRQGVKWNDGKAFSATDVAYTFNLFIKNPSLNIVGTPLPTSATSSGSSVTLNFSAPQYANLFLIGQVNILPQHIWSSVGDPTKFADPSPVGTGPFMLDKFSPQGFSMKQNPYFWDKSKLHVPEVDFPSYTSNANLVPPVASGAIDWAGNQIPGIKANYLAKSPDNHTWTPTAPYLSANNVVSLWFNVTKAPMNDAAVRQAVSLGINRDQLSAQGEAGNEAPATSSSGLLLPRDSTFLSSSLANDLPGTGDAAKVSSILTADGWAKTGGKWTKAGKQITFSIEDPIPYSDYYLDAQLITRQLNALGFNVTVKGDGDPNVWNADVANGTFDTAIHWSAQGPTPYFIYDNEIDSALTAAVGKPAGANYGRYSNPQVQAALAQYAGTSDNATQAAAVTKIETIMSTQVPVAPLLYGAAWAEFSTRHYTGWPSPSNAYMDPGPNSPYLEYTILQLKAVS
ncbi:MAG: peptide/nickel transport system substrate-binding protein [Streptosporangiaceae bacterium]|jgi:peptide/nickel transport system substrate-binding protein|nr:peptide/nickel transport system substrate-binding protein [Streptosporangiaceae bacterium]